MIPEQYKIKNTVKHPTSVIVGGLSRLGMEIAESLIEQGGYVIIVDNFTTGSLDKLGNFPKGTLISFVDYQGITSLEDDLRRLDYFFYFAHDNSEDLDKVSSQDFLNFSNYLDVSLNIAAKFEAKFLLTTSIRAHQRNITNDDLSLNFNPLNEVRHTVYTNYEQQRYAESLVIEYNQKVNLDSRIIRIADLIGDGLDFSKRTDFTDLIIQACEGDVLKLKNDGLESEYLLHLLDAAYGIIKAQFSQNTNGKVFSLSYEQPITHLSIAYKIQEVDPSPRTIQFIESKDSMSSIKLYKPAPNLTQIGWLPRVDLEKAIKQSLAIAKIGVLEKETEDHNRNKGFVEKLRSFVDMANKDEPTMQDFSSGPITRLIEERKRKEELKKQKFELSNMSVKDRKRRKAYTAQEKISRAVWNFFGKLGNTFNVFKNRNPIEGTLILVLIVGGIVLYFTLISPLVVLGRNYLFFKSEAPGLIASLNSPNFDSGLRNLSRLSQTIEETTTQLEKITWFTNLLQLGPQSQELSKLTEGYATIVDGIENIEKFYTPLNQYLLNYKNNLQLRSSETNYLSTLDSGLNYNDYLLEVSNNSPFLEIGLQKVQKGIAQINQVNTSQLPAVIAEDVSSLNTSIANRFKDSNVLKLASFTPELLGLDGRRNYAILLQDNTIPRFRGGTYPVLAIIGVENGAVVSINVQSTKDLQFNLASLPLTEVQTVEFAYTQQSQLSFDSLANIVDDMKFGEYLKSVIKDSLNVDISGYLEVNLNFIETLLDSTNISFAINNSLFGDSSYISSLNAAQPENTNAQIKSRVMAESFANMLYYFTNSPNTYANLITEALTQSIKNEDANFGFFANSINDVYMNSLELEQDSDGSVALGYSLIDSKVVNNNKYSIVSFATQVKFMTNGRVSHSGNIKLPILGAAQDVIVCLPTTVLDSSININGFNPQRFVINTKDDEKCLVFRVINETEINFSYIDTNSFITSTADGLYGYTLKFARIEGLSQTIDVELSAESPYRITKISPGDNTSNAFRLTNQQDHFLEIEITSN